MSNFSNNSQSFFCALIALEKLSNKCGDLVGEKGWNCVADLSILAGKRSKKLKLIRKTLNPRPLSHTNASLLLGMRERTARNIVKVTGDCSRRHVPTQPSVCSGVVFQRYAFETRGSDLNWDAFPILSLWNMLDEVYIVVICAMAYMVL